MTLNPNTIYEQDDGIVELWQVQGIHGAYYASKQIAEEEARKRFPNELPFVRYARISFKNYQLVEQ